MPFVGIGSSSWAAPPRGTKSAPGTEVEVNQFRRTNRCRPPTCEVLQPTDVTGSNHVGSRTTAEGTSREHTPIHDDRFWQLILLPRRCRPRILREIDDQLQLVLLQFTAMIEQRSIELVDFIHRAHHFHGHNNFTWLRRLVFKILSRAATASPNCCPNCIVPNICGKRFIRRHSAFHTQNLGFYDCVIQPECKQYVDPLCCLVRINGSRSNAHPSPHFIYSVNETDSVRPFFCDCFTILRDNQSALIAAVFDCVLKLLGEAAESSCYESKMSFDGTKFLRSRHWYALRRSQLPPRECAR